MNVFTAGVQYGDWAGTAKADDVHKPTVRDLLRAKNLIRDNEFVVGLSLFIGENRPGEVKPPYISAFVVPATDFESAKDYIKRNDPVPLREVRLDITLEEFLGLFKRFSIALAWGDLGLNGREYETAYES
jgi:hypothetical protein